MLIFSISHEISIYIIVRRIIKKKHKLYVCVFGHTHIIAIFSHISINFLDVNSLVPFPITISKTTWSIRHSVFSFHSTFPHLRFGNQLGQHKLLAASNSKYFSYYLTALTNSYAQHLWRLMLWKHSSIGNHKDFAGFMGSFTLALLP